MTKFKEFYPEIKPNPKSSPYFTFTLILIVLKLSGLEFTTDWTWWTVTSPLWIPVVFYFVLLIAYTLVWLILKFLLLFRK